jgi:Mn-dependent DtxR family transcriptional regulator
MEDAAAQAGLKSPYWYLLIVALTFEPQPISPGRLRIRSPYVSPSLYQKRFEKLVRSGLLMANDRDEHFLTEEGRALARRIIQTAYSEMDVLEPIPPVDLSRLSNLLHKLVDACLAAPEPPGKWCLKISHNLDPGEKAPVVVKIDQHLTDLTAYRDDAHLAAWQPNNLYGHVWETFTILWQGEASTLDEVHQKLERREYSRLDYAQALQELSARDWAQEALGKYRLTEQGRQIRQQVEDLTESYFFFPWACLDEKEITRLRKLLVRFRDALG